MFGVDWRDHDERYEYAAEWLQLMRRLWTESEEFDFDGRFFQGKGLWSEPKPIQSPLPLMNAGSSDVGQAFSARHCDMNFVMLRQKSDDEDQAQISKLKRMALDNGRRSQCWIHAYVVCRDTEKEAQQALNRYVREKGDWDTASRMVEMFGIESGTLDADVLDAFKFHFIAGHGAYPLVGTPEQIVDGMERLSSLGVDGILLSWLDYLGECRQWIDEVLPLMEQAGQRRQPTDPAIAAAIIPASDN
jgi:alkanesulfonate monooxygenase SsuD/methylene tetrahydromethanopterin reductase-like flavin-dependent oxidoreductase (luciferase family)